MSVKKARLGVTKFADEIVVRSKLSGPQREFVLEVDGEPFPWWLDASGIATVVTDGEMPAVTITIPANRVRIDNEVGDRA